MTLLCNMSDMAVLLTLMITLLVSLERAPCDGASILPRLRTKGAA
jgi:hypothetical protein